MRELEVFKTCLEKEKAACIASAEALAKDGRRDDANMKQIRGNIFGIFLSLSGAAERKFPNDVKSFLSDKIDTIPEAWVASLTTAQEHGDYAKAAVEEVKLAAIGEIKAEFSGVWGDSK